jgi:ABC-type nitrate/sulfonate/bicarbonate transport system permease component
MRSENGCQHRHDGCVRTIPRISFALIGVIVVKFIGTKREFGKVTIESEVTLQNPDMMVALFMLMIMNGCTW